MYLKYSKYTFVRTSVNNGKHNAKEDKNDIAIHKKGRSSILETGFLAKDKGVITGTRMTGESKGKTSVLIIELCKKQFCQIVIGPRNQTTKYQPLDARLMKSAKSFISNKYKAWFSEQVSK